ncbi:S41 family peptidase [Echinicola rosea]|nr:S41 family peptidase [Echinicola rosea]
MKISTTYNWLIALVLIASFTISCSDREMEPNPKPIDDDEDDIENPNIAINEWIQAVMDEVYLWTDTMNDPISVDAAPENYFDALLVNQDRFSVIYGNYEELVNLLEGVQKEAGYEIQLFQASNSNDVFGIITYVKQGGPADQAGLKRNDRFYEINGVQMTLSNYTSLLQSRGEPHTLDIRRLNEDSGQFEMLAEDPVSLSTTELVENPIFLDSVYTIDNTKIGYLVYNFFAPGEELESDNIRYGVYDQQLEDIFADFKSKGVQELILDLRYNGGGYTSSAVHLASLVGQGISEGDLFYYTKYNDLVQAYFQQEYGPEYFNIRFVNKTQNIGDQLGSGKVYILTSNNTASSSELIINGLSPYMEVILIGETTYGKNVGSITIQDTENEENDYGLLPIISQSFNKNDNSDYTNGFDPDIESDEFSNNGILLPIGDTNEVMLSAAIAQITGTPAAERSRKAPINMTSVQSSIKNHVRFGRMIESTPEFK